MVGSSPSDFCGLSDWVPSDSGGMADDGWFSGGLVEPLFTVFWDVDLWWSEVSPGVDTAFSGLAPSTPSSSKI